MQKYTLTAQEKDLILKIKTLKKKRQALIIAHNYQIPAIQEIADFTGDSLELSRTAANTDAKIIIFCGVHFMAESASIFSPDKMVLIPDLKAGCSLADSINGEVLRAWKQQYPDAVVVSYINTTAEVKAESDYCCTSTNAVNIVNSIPQEKRILFIPDMFLADFVRKRTGRDIISYPGECHVHAKVKPTDILAKMEENPESEFLIHPECGCVSSCMHYVATGEIPGEKTKILSTSGMLNYAHNSKSSEFVVATETGILHRLEKENPKKKFIPLRKDMVCEYMKMITLPKLYNSLLNLEFEVKVPREIAIKAKVPIERMLALKN